MSAYSPRHGVFELRRRAVVASGFLCFSVYVLFATAASVIAPFLFPLFLAPFALIMLAAAPQGRAIPRVWVWPLVLAAAALMPFWPTYIHLRLGPLPILTPPRVIFYILSAIWVYDMAVSPWRRGQFLQTLNRRRWLAALVLGFFTLNILSVPMAEGRGLAAKEAFRQLIILLLPFCIFATYIRRARELRWALVALAVGAGAASVIAIGEFASQTLISNILAPLIMSEGEWLRIALDSKARDGVFRAQATHTHPISLGEYLTFCAPVALALACGAKGRARLLWVGAIVLIFGGIFATQSRGAVIALAPGFGLVGAVVAFRALADPKMEAVRPLIGLGCLIAVAASPIVAGVAYQVTTGEAGTSAARSSQGRIDQINLAWPKIVKRPVLGYGSGRAAKIVGYYGRALSLDNYYLTLAVDLGLPGPILFLCMLIVCARGAVAASQTGPPGAPGGLDWALLGFAGAIAAIIVSRLIISQTGNLNMLFPLIGAYMGATTPRRRRAASPAVLA